MPTWNNPGRGPLASLLILSFTWSLPPVPSREWEAEAEKHLEKRQEKRHGQSDVTTAPVARVEWDGRSWEPAT